MEYKIGSVVVHKAHGLCDLIGTTFISGKEYYRAVPKTGEKVTIFIPVDNVENSLVTIMSVKEADEILKYIKTIDDEIIVMDKQKRDSFKKRILDDNKQDLAYLAWKLYQLKKDKESKGIELGNQDKTLYERTYNRLLDEMSLSYNIDRDKIGTYIIERMKNV